MKKWGWPTFTQTNLFCSQTRIIGAWVQLTRTATVAAFGASAGGMDTLWLVGGAADGTGSVHSWSLFQSFQSTSRDGDRFFELPEGDFTCKISKICEMLTVSFNSVKRGETRWNLWSVSAMFRWDRLGRWAWTECRRPSAVLGQANRPTSDGARDASC